MKDARAMAYVNMYGVLGTLENLCALDGKAKEILAGLKKPVSLCLEVKGGPCCTFHFTREGCRMTEGSEGCTCKMRFASPEKFNDLIDHSKPGLPVKGAVQLLSFLLGPFTKLTNRLTELLRPSEEAMRERAFFEESTISPCTPWPGRSRRWPTTTPFPNCRPRTRWTGTCPWASKTRSN